MAPQKFLFNRKRTLADLAQHPTHGLVKKIVPGAQCASCGTPADVEALHHRMAA